MCQVEPDMSGIIEPVARALPGLRPLELAGQVPLDGRSDPFDDMLRRRRGQGVEAEHVSDQAQSEKLRNDQVRPQLGLVDALPARNARGRRHLPAGGLSSLEGSP